MKCARRLIFLPLTFMDCRFFASRFSARVVIFFMLPLYHMSTHCIHCQRFLDARAGDGAQVCLSCSLDHATEDAEQEAMRAAKRIRKKWAKRIGCGVFLFLLLVVALFIVLVFFARYQLQQPEKAVSGAQPTAFTPASVTPSTDGSLRNPATLDDPSIGPLDAQVTVVEFSDFECPFCKQAFPIVRELMAQYGDRMRFVYRDFPIASLHEQATKAAEAGECAHVQGKFWALHDKIFQNAPAITVPELKQYAKEVGLSTAVFDACLDSGQYTQEVQSDLADGASLGVRGTPTWFINGHKIEGVIPRDVFVKLLDQLLAVPSK